MCPFPIALLLGSLRMDFNDIRVLVLSVNDEKCTEQLLEQLQKYMPNKEEMMQLTTFKDKINDLSDAERFGVIVSHQLVAWVGVGLWVGLLEIILIALVLLQMSDVKRLSERLDSMLTRIRFPEEIGELQPVSHYNYTDHVICM